MLKTIEVYCDDRSHDDRPWIVTVLAREPGDDNWYPHYIPWNDPDQRLRHTGSAMQWLASPGTKGPARLRYRFKCQMCGACVEGRSERVTEVLDKLAAEEQQRCSLQLLAAIL